MSKNNKKRRKRTRRKKNFDILNTKERKKVKFKSNVLFFTFFLFFSLVVAQVLHLEITHTSRGKDIQAIAENQVEVSNILEADRGIIYDSQGNPLAVNIKEYKLTAVLDPKHTRYDQTIYEYVPYYVTDPTEAAETIIDVLGYEDDEEAKDLIYSQLMQDPSKVKQVEFGKYGNAISLEEKVALEKSGVTGLEFEEKANRYYPYGDFASYIIGYARQYVDEETGEVTITGEMGVEKLLEGYLRGEEGEVEEVVDKQGVPLEEPQIIEPKTDGSNVYLTIDSSIQSYVHDFMNEYAKDQKFTYATTVVMDADTGAILGAEKMPSFNPNTKDITDYQDPYFEMCFEPGSIIKTFLVAQAMIEGVWNPDETFPSGIRTEESWGLRNDGEDNYIADWIYNEKKGSWGTITLAQGYYFSSNVGMTYLLDDVGYENWIETMTGSFEFGKPIQNTLYESSACKFDPQNDFETATTAFGQGMTSNVMQILRGYSTFSGDGRMVNPYLIDRIEDPDTGEIIYEGIHDKPVDWVEGKDGVEYDEEKDMYYKQILTEEQNDEILDLMEGATYYNEGGDFQGTGASYEQNTKYRIGTKTGTAEVSVDGQYDVNSSLFSVVIMAPVDDPQIIVYSSVLKPQVQYPQGYMKMYTGAIIDNTLDYLKGETQNEIEYNNDTDIVVEIDNYIGKKLEEAKATIESEGIDVRTLGSGKVKYQYPYQNTLGSKSKEFYLIGDTVKPEDYKGIQQDDALNYCLAYQVECEFKGVGGGVVSTIIPSEEKYIVTLVKE